MPLRPLAPCAGSGTRLRCGGGAPRLVAPAGGAARRPRGADCGRSRTALASNANRFRRRPESAPARRRRQRARDMLAAGSRDRGSPPRSRPASPRTNDLSKTCSAALVAILGFSSPAALPAYATSRPDLLRVDEAAGHGIGCSNAQDLLPYADRWAFDAWRATLPGWRPYFSGEQAGRAARPIAWKGPGVGDWVGIAPQNRAD